jgi:hypothetical protein
MKDTACRALPNADGVENAAASRARFDPGVVRRQRDCADCAPGRHTGGTTLFGTDLGAADYDPADEYALMAQAGMTVGDSDGADDGAGRAIWRAEATWEGRGQVSAADLAVLKE